MKKRSSSGLRNQGIEVRSEKTSARHALQQIRSMAAAAACRGQDRKLTTIFRRRISRLKKKTRRAALIAAAPDLPKRLRPACAIDPYPSPLTSTGLLRTP
jgi:hypothetical protein